MDKKILPGFVGGDEAVALVVAEPLDGSCCHAVLHGLCAAYAGGCEEQRLRALALLYRAIARPNRAYATGVAPRSPSGSYPPSDVALPTSRGGETDGSTEEQREERSGGGA